MSHPITIVSKDGLRKQTIKATPMRTLQSVLEEYLALAEQSEGFEDEQLELRLVERRSLFRASEKKCDMDCPIRLMNLPKDAKFRVHRKQAIEQSADDDDRDKAASEAKQRGIDLYVKMKYKEAERAFTEAIEISTEKDLNKHLYYSNRSACFMQQSKYAEAAADARKTTELSRAFQKGWSRLGMCLYKIHLEGRDDLRAIDVGNVEQCKTALEKCLSLGANEEAKDTLRKVQEKLRSIKEAQREQQQQRRGNNNSNNNSSSVLSKVGEFLSTARYQYSYGLSDTGRIIVNCIVAALVFFLLRNWIGLGARRAGRQIYGNGFDDDFGDFDDNTFTFGTFIGWMVLYIAWKNGASPFTLYMLAQNLGLLGNNNRRRGGNYGGGGYGGGYGRRRGMFF